ncbi:hypothetical protein EGW08_019980 [Elysia chlorotica]|uniref:Secreted protein n=1 Tax=Elysia chlorotica TaxID=188477 RepID=A0A433SSY6_ELYCH|nr:hypothetical protein EGW08_019980 [Elysia chlorotica]
MNGAKRSPFQPLPFFVALVCLVPRPSWAMLKKNPRQPLCLQTPILSQCNVNATFGRPLGQIKCGETVPTVMERALWTRPRLQIDLRPGLRTNAGKPIKKVLVIMVDTDALLEVGVKSSSFSYLLWAAVFKLKPHGFLVVFRTITSHQRPFDSKRPGGQVYIQMFVFILEDDKFIFNIEERRFHLCRMVSTYELDEPIASTHFTFKF